MEQRNPQRQAVDDATRANLEDLLAGRCACATFGSDSPRESPGALFPGSFNPLHHGHRTMAMVAQAVLGRPIVFELSAANVDKPPLSVLEIQRRLAQFDPIETIAVTSAPTFLAKARLFPGATFVVGADTLCRVGALRYYNHDPALRQDAIEVLRAAACQFLVFGRKQGDAFLSADDLDLPTALRELCRTVPEREFRCDVSSTELRKKQRGDATP